MSTTTEPQPHFTPGTLVKARGRDWVVLPDSTDDILMVRPIGGLDDEVVGICRAIENVSSGEFDPPDPNQPGDFNSCRLLRDAARIATRSAAGPFRSFGKIAVEPRPYQLVPLLMAMRLDPVRMLIADDVGIGKTVEASLIAKEMIERGEITRMAVLCPPHLAEQWQKELREKFHIDAELVLSSTVQRLERGLRAGESLFRHYPFVIVSTDFVKSTRHRHDFVRECPEFVIVDEAHTCTSGGRPGQSRQARFELIKAIADDPERHLILVTATPHSGNEDAFRSLLSLVDKKFSDLPRDLEAESKSALRVELAKHLVQRLRGNVIEMDREMSTTTSFPDREDAEDSYKLTPEYKALFQRVVRFAGELVSDDSGNQRNRRVRWWSALALLRAMASSPAAAAATMRNRAITADENDEKQLEETASRTVLDQDESDDSLAVDFTPGSNPSDDSASETSQRLNRLALSAEELFYEHDAKFTKLVKLLKKLLKEGYQPIVFCRFIDTADYVAAGLREKIKKVDKVDVEIAAVTGTLPPKEREDRIADLVDFEKRILVCTDCLSEGINLQHGFDAVIHYDLSWNPTRHEQREGRVDRFGQASDKVRVLTYFGVDNQIDGIVLDVLLRKHKKIKSDLNISIAVPGGSDDVVKALFEGMELRGQDTTPQMFLPGMDPIKEKLHTQWDDARDREKKSRARFAQLSIKTEEVRSELAAIREAIGAGPTVNRFLRDTLHLAGVPVANKPLDCIEVTIDNDTSRAMRHAIARDRSFIGRFDLPVEDDTIYLSRTHPIVEGLASYVLETALDDVQAEGEPPLARRCGVTKTSGVTEKTSVIVTRFRYQLYVKRKGASDDDPMLAEEVRIVAFTGSADDPQWVPDEEARALLDISPSGNLPPSLVKQQLTHFISTLESLRPAIDRVAMERAQTLRDAHTRIRKSVRMTGQMRVEPMYPVDLLGAFILLP